MDALLLSLAQNLDNGKDHVKSLDGWWINYM